MERETGLEPATSSLGSCASGPVLLAPNVRAQPVFSQCLHAQEFRAAKSLCANSASKERSIRTAQLLSEKPAQRLGSQARGHGSAASCYSRIAGVELRKRGDDPHHTLQSLLLRVVGSRRAWPRSCQAREHGGKVLAGTRGSGAYRGFSRVELNAIARLVQAHRDRFLKSRHEFFGR
jgi:hypothetical protein